MKVLVTGCAGFIGMHCAKKLLARGDEVVGLDNLSPYYAVELKRDRLRQLEDEKAFRFVRLDLVDAGALGELFAAEKPEAVLSELDELAGPSPLSAHRDAIDRCFAGDSVEAILAALEGDGSPWAMETLRRPASIWERKRLVTSS